jgi:hypothetical protein
MPAIKYSFNRKEMNNWKARITERLIHCYIDDVLIPMLRKQGWDNAIFSPHAWFGDEVEENKHRPDYMKIFWRHEEKFFIKNRLFPTQDLMVKFKRLTKTLQNVPDGFLFKLKTTGELKRLNEALKELQVSPSWSEGDYTFNYQEQNGDKLLPIVDGEIEVVEIKSDKATLPSHQKRSYGNILREGYVLRFFHVNIVSFEKNEFEIEERLLTVPKELKTFSLKKQKFS